MAGELIGALRVALGLDSAQFETGTKKVQSSLKSLETSFAGMQAAVARFAGIFGVALSAQALVQFTSQAVQAAAALGRVAEQSGLSTTQLQQLAFAFRDTTVNQEQLAQASATLARNLSELQTGTGGFLSFLRNSAPHLVEQFRNVTDVSQAWSLLADVLQGLPNAHDRVRVAQAALGEAGARVAQQMGRLGSEGLRQAGEEAIRLGQVMDERTIRQARELESQFRQLSTALSSTFASAAVRAAEALGLLGLSLESLEAQYRHNGESITRLRSIIDSLAPGSALRAVREREYATLLAETQKLLDRIIERRRQLAPALTDDANATRLVANALARANEQLQAFNDRLQGTPILFDQAGLFAQGYAQRVEQAMRLVAAATEDAGAVAARQTAMRLQLARQEQQAILQTASMAAQAITALFPKQKGAAIAAAVINTAVGITRALSEVPWPWNWVQAGLIAAQGVAQIAAIRSASPSGGGSAPSVGGGGTGGGTGDTQGQAPTLVRIELKQGDLFSSEQVVGLMGQMSELVKNGNVLISTKVV